MAALDVFHNEPINGGSDPLVAMGIPSDVATDNIVATPHFGYVTRSNLASHFNYAFDQILAWLAGKPIKVTNPEVLHL